MWEILISGLIGVLGGSISAYLIIKRFVNNDKIIEIFDDLTDEMVNNEEFQKKIFVIGALLGNGIKSGLGLNPRRGKFKFEDLISMAIASFFQKSMGQSSTETSNLYEKFFSGGQ